ncbi:putative membrane protein [Waddlia chondrophila 2032/99]|uniref:Putative membrane protein n=2 Tax=Waddlia chondrophila TaxID=71667 RepID=D6YV06_WADCW|nr:hypothetical protein [Waddlia chondrophila]ADI37967.1 putative membrane protein [Waddlia chondrophila WSU 86-1044]CCB91893.1 putative membrane protein [Waddlia chondrophila 2032/99]
MKLWKKTAILLTCSSMLCLNTSEGIEYCTDTGGCAYEDAYQSCCIAPAIAFALVAIAGIIAVGVHNRSSSSHTTNAHTQ